MRVLFFLFLIVFAFFLVPRYLGPTTPIIEALKQENIDFKNFQETTSRNISKLYELDEEGNSALHYACKLGRVDILKLIINYIDYFYCLNKDILYQHENEEGMTPLTIAICSLQPKEVLNLIIEKSKNVGAIDLNDRNKDGDTPLHVFFREHKENLFQPNELRTLKILRDNGASLNPTNNYGEGPLFLLDSVSVGTVFDIWNPDSSRGTAEVCAETIKHNCLIL